jgi:dephospho-CoA kinase
LFHGIPIIGIAGGIGSGKSHVARLFAELGCLVIDSDAQVAVAYGLPEVRRTLEEWWGPQVYLPDGRVNRRLIAQRIFADPAARARLEGLLHPIVARLRDEEMAAALSGAATSGARRDGPPVAFIWDAPLLFETGLNRLCDAVVFVESPLALRLERVRLWRGWDDSELARRENSQWPLDNKRGLSDYVLTNTASTASLEPIPPLKVEGRGIGAEDAAAADPLRDQVRLALSQILVASSGSGRE